MAEDFTNMTEEELTKKIEDANQVISAITSEKQKRLEDELQARQRIIDSKDAYVEQLAQTSMDIMSLQGTLRQIKKGSANYSKEQLDNILSTLSTATFQAVDLLKNVISIIK